MPYVIYETGRHHGAVGLATASTRHAALEVFTERWWQDGQRAYPNANRLLVLAEADGFNSDRAPG